jgi:glycosyltransferase involved in cell wall biosynthesis
MSKAPKVSVVTSVYNGEKYIEECVQSILHQSFEDFEFILLDNGSTDGTAELLDRINDPRVRVVHQENLGISQSLNKGVHLARGELIVRLDADDVSYPHRLEHQVKFMDANKDYVLCGGGYQRWIDGSLSPQTVPLPLTDHDIRRCLSRFNPIAHSAVVFRKDAFLQVGGYDRHLLFTQDYDLWIRLMKIGKACNLEENLGFVRFYEASTWSRNKRITFFETLKVKWKAYSYHGGSLFYLIYFLLRGLLVLVVRNYSEPKKNPD